MKTKANPLKRFNLINDYECSQVSFNDFITELSAKEKDQEIIKRYIEVHNKVIKSLRDLYKEADHDKEINKILLENKLK